MTKRIILTVFIMMFSLSGVSMVGAANPPVELCLTLDGSGSIAASDFTIQLQGVASSIQDPNIVPRDSTVAIAVVQFSNSAQLEVARTVIDSDATATSVANQVLAITQIDSTTAIGDGIALCAQQFTFAAGWKQIIDISTDGSNNAGVDPVTAANNAVTAGVDAINAIGVGPGVNVAELNSIVRPQPAKTLGQGDGFVVTVNNFNEYVTAMGNKIGQETGGLRASADVPTMTEWGMLIMSMLLGVSAVLFMRKRRNA